MDAIDRRLLVGFLMGLALVLGCEQGEPTTTVLPDALTRRFQASPDSALAEFRNRTVRLRTKVLITGHTRLVLEGGAHAGKRLPSISCDLADGEEEAAGRLAQGALVTVVGTVEAFDPGLSTLRLRDCRLLP